MSSSLQSSKPPENLYHKAIDLLSRREHSRFELQRKLYRYTTDDTDAAQTIKTALDRVQEEGLQSDFRFAETYLYFRSQRGYGPERIREELKQRKIAPDIITHVFLEGEQDWSLLATQVRIKKFGEDNPLTAVDRSKQRRFLYYRGFNSDHLSESL